MGNEGYYSVHAISPGCRKPRRPAQGASRIVCSHATGSSVEGWGQEEDYCNSILEIVRACRHWAEIVTSAL
ncbi:hypothetical protein PC119_g13912 [Phytophthora cactorum]|nr:hypothetical protein PC119_g13912 [Phytophthora cactorum]